MSIIKKYRLITTVPAFYGSLEEEFRSLNYLIDSVLYRRTHWRKQYYILMREASNFLYSRVKKTKSQTMAKADFIYLEREARHMGYPIGVDTIRWTSLDKEVRDVADYLIIKGVGIMGLPKDLNFVYSYITPDSMMDPHESVFCVIEKKGGIGLGRFEEPSFHKKEFEDMLDIFGLEPEYGEVPDYGDTTRNTVGDFEHADIIVKRMTLPEDMRSYRKIAKVINRSVETISRHIREHNREVHGSRSCSRCRRIKSPYATEEVH